MEDSYLPREQIERYLWKLKVYFSFWRQLILVTITVKTVASCPHPPPPPLAFRH